MNMVLLCFVFLWLWYMALWSYWKSSNISHTKSQQLNVSRLVLQFSLPNPLKPGVKLRMKMYLEQCWQMILHLHLSDQQFYCLLILDVWLYINYFLTLFRDASLEPMMSSWMIWVNQHVPGHDKSPEGVKLFLGLYCIYLCPSGFIN